MFTGVFCCAARQNCAQCRWPWEWPTRKDNVSFGWRRPGMTEYKVSSFVVRSHHPYLEICFFLGVQHPMCWDDEISFRCLHSKHAFFRPAETGFQTIFHPSWTKVVPQETYRQPPATCAQGGPQWKLIDQLSMVKLLDLLAWETTNLRHVWCEMQKLWRCVDVAVGFFPFVLEKQLLSSSQFCGKWHVVYRKWSCSGPDFLKIKLSEESLFIDCEVPGALFPPSVYVEGAGCLHPPCLWFFLVGKLEDFDVFIFNSEAPSHWGEKTDDPPTKKGN